MIAGEGGGITEGFGRGRASVLGVRGGNCTGVAHPGGGGSTDALREALKRVAVALKDAGVPFALGGGYAVYARGGPEPEHDVDFMIEPDAADRAVHVLAEAGLRIERPAEDWLAKAWWDDGDQPGMVDLVHEVGGAPVDAALLSRADVIELLSVRMPVLDATDLLSTKMRAMSEHYCDFGRLLPAARALREQVDWDRLRQETADNNFAAAFLFLAERLGIADRQPVG